MFKDFENSFMRGELDYRKLTLKKNADGVLEDENGNKIKQVELTVNHTKYYEIMLSAVSTSLSYDEGKAYDTVTMTIFMDQDSAGPIPKIGLPLALILTGLLIVLVFKGMA